MQERRQLAARGNLGTDFVAMGVRARIQDKAQCDGNSANNHGFQNS
jgi:hypothetical protein